MADSVEISHLDLSFGQLEGLRGMNLEIQDGEYLILLGPSGCAKSILLNCNAGLLRSP